MDTSDFRLIHISFEYHIVHIRHRRNGRTIIEVIRLNHRVSYFHRNIQNHTRNGAPYLRCTADIRVFSDTVTYNLQFTLRRIPLFNRFLIIGLAGLKLFLRDYPLFIKLLIPFINLFDLLQRDFRHINTRLGAVQLHHFGNNLNRGNNLSRFDHLPGLFLQFGNNS